MERNRGSKQPNLVSSGPHTDDVHVKLKGILLQLTSVISKSKPHCSTCEEFVSKLSQHIQSSHGNGSSGNFSNSTRNKGNRDLRTRKPVNYKDMEQQTKQKQDSDSESQRVILEDFDIKQENFLEGPVSDDNDEDFIPGYEDFDTEPLDERMNAPDDDNGDTHPYECNICNKKFTLERSVYRHRRNIHKDMSLPCLVCQENFVDTQTLNDHALKFHPKPRRDPIGIKKAFECSICQTQFSHHHSLRKHERNIHKDKSFPCQSCPEKFLAKNDLREHRRLVHTRTSKDFLCTDCGKTFVFQNELNRHSLTHTYTTSDEKTYKCNHPGCPSSFHLKDQLRRHMRDHGDKSHVCAICDKKYNRKEYLVSHMRVHTGEKPYTCAHAGCNKSFRTKSGLCIHRKHHVGVKSHICDTCGKAFTLKHQLVTHSRIHTGEKRYVCEECGRGFTQTAHLKTHRKKHKNNNENPSTSNSNQLGIQSQELELEFYF